ncbi:MAG TPA: acylphosphatase [Phycisphaerae bacterium]|nr:acylphosphatase [Phycisphaerae bacterium]
MIRKTVHFSGRVQGVGFRYTACQIASGFPVAGFVRNLPDGRVQMVVEAEGPDVERFLAALNTEMSGNIRDRQEQQSAATGEFRGFDVRF